VVKRSLDVVLAVFLLVLALPVLAFSALLIRWDSDGPILFRQARMGRDFKPFQLLKLRTMRQSMKGTAFTLGADPRITRVGRWLRWLKIDELPQLWNVLRGEMSMVGPRPVVPELALEFRRSFERLLRSRPGLTDPATLKYCREAEMLDLVPDPMRYFKSVVTPDKLLISQLYQQRATVLSDLCVLAATALALLLPDRRTRLIPLRTGKTPVAAFPAPVSAVPIPTLAEKMKATTPFEYPLDVPLRDKNGRVAPTPFSQRRLRKNAAADRVEHTRLVP
jgi:lipopolysaccharide/colanic/teichoic acid biosynthesis glycosyltransferase